MPNKRPRRILAAVGVILAALLCTACGPATITGEIWISEPGGGALLVAHDKTMSQITVSSVDRCMSIDIAVEAIEHGRLKVADAEWDKTAPNGYYFTRYEFDAITGVELDNTWLYWSRPHLPIGYQTGWQTCYSIDVDEIAFWYRDSDPRVFVLSPTSMAKRCLM